MNKKQLIDAVACKAELTKKDAAAAVDAVFDAIAAALAEGDKVQVLGFGTFSVKAKAERAGVNPKTGEKITIAASKAPAFSAGADLKKSVNG